MEKTSIEDRQSNIDLVMRTLYPELEYEIIRRNLNYRDLYYRGKIQFMIFLIDSGISPDVTLKVFRTNKYHCTPEELFKLRDKIRLDMLYFLNEDVLVG